MFYVLLSVSVSLSALAFTHWRQRLKRVEPSPSFEDQGMSDWPDLIGIMLPPRLRALWYALWGAFFVFLFGFMHLAAIVTAADSDSSLMTSIVLYLASLSMWLATLVWPASWMDKWTRRSSSS